MQTLQPRPAAWFGGDEEIRHAFGGRASAFGIPASTLAARPVAWFSGADPTRHAGRASAFGGCIK